MPVPKLIM